LKYVEDNLFMLLIIYADQLRYSRKPSSSFLSLKLKRAICFLHKAFNHLRL